MKRCIAILALTLLTATTAFAQVTGAVTQYFSNYKRTDLATTAPSVANCETDTTNRTICVDVEGGFVAEFFTQEIVDSIYSGIRRYLPSKYADYKLTVRAYEHAIEDLVPPSYRKDAAVENRIWQQTYEGKPWVQNFSRPYTAYQGLEGRHIVLWQSHGKYFKLGGDGWLWQRPRLYCATEDLLSQTIVLPYIIPMLQNAGAVVYTPRERDWQSLCAVVDNDTPDKGGKYKEAKGREHEWEPTDMPGFAHLKDVYEAYDTLFRDGTARKIRTVVSRRHESLAIWQPDIPETGEYAVYVSYQSLPESVDDAHYIVHHLGGQTDFYVNQRMGGRTWVYLGTFKFAKGMNASGKVMLSNHSRREGLVTADAVRFGGGMGNVTFSTDSIKRPTSGLPRWAEGARYSAQWAGMPDSVFNVMEGKDEYRNDIYTRPYMLNYMAGGSPYVPNYEGLGVPLEVSCGFHTDAGYRENGIDLVGSLGICTTSSEYTEGKLNTGLERLMSHDLISTIMHNATIDMKKYNWRVRALWDRNYAETREPMIPSIIFEMLSHQNFADMCRAYDPHFKFDLARSIYKSITKYMATLHQTDYIIQPLPVKKFAIDLNDRTHTARLTWEPTGDPLEPTAVPDRYIVYTRVGDGGFDNGQIVLGTTAIMQQHPGIIYSYKVTALNNGGESFPSETLSAYVSKARKGTALIVNGFTRLEGPAQVNTDKLLGFDLDKDPGVQYGRFAGFCGRQKTLSRKEFGGETETSNGFSGSELEGMVIMGNTFDYPYTHGKGIALAKDYSFTSCSEEALTNAMLDPKKHKMVDFIYGVQKDINEGTKLMLANYMTRGGNVLMSGSHVMRNDSVLSTSMMVMHNDSVGKVQNDTVIALPALKGFGSENVTFCRTMNTRCYAVPDAEILQPAANATVLMNYARCEDEPDKPAVVATEGNGYRCVAMGFPLESIVEEDRRNQLISIITKYLCK